MLNDTQKAALWETIDRLDRSEKEELRTRLERSLRETPVDRQKVAEALAEMKQRSQGVTLGDDLTIRDLIDEGRRF